MTSLRARLHRVVTVVHRWTGLALALFLMIVGVTGSMLAFRSRLDSLVNPGFHVTPHPGQQVLDLATLAERAEAAMPHARAAYFTVDPDQVLVHLAGRTDSATGKPWPVPDLPMVLNPYTGEVLHAGLTSNPERPPIDLMGFTYALHTSLATRTSWGWTLVGVIALLWTIDSFVALVVTLPRSAGPFWPRWRQAWKVKLSASARRLHFDLHRAGGLWLWPVLVVFGWSSVMLGLSSVYEPVTGALFDYVPPDQGIMTLMLPTPLEKPRLTWREAQSIGEQTMARVATEHHFAIERPYGMAYVAEFGGYTYAVRSSLDLRGHGWDTTVLIDGTTGAVRAIDLPRGQHAGNTLSTLLWGIHYGDLRDSLPFRIFVCLLGLYLTVISYTGVAIWWHRTHPIRTARG
ncbi:MAG TPA: PepSY-associated TM helix domain-containing protein [Gemmatimonadales bacterium]|nr:PepSY-associated TM helix domain-containing protein [Gemmatimonadales bacterium]